MISNSTRHPFSLFELYQRIEKLHNHLQSQGKLDGSGECLVEDPFSQLENLSPRQKKAIEDLYSIIFIVKGQDGKPYFRITVRQILDKIREIVSKMPGVSIQDIVLIGSAANAVLESDPSYLSSIGTALDKDSPIEGVCFKPLEVNDFDVRIYLKGATQEKRLEISNALIAYYAVLSKKQYAWNLAKVTTEKYLETIKDQIIRHIVSKFKNNKERWSIAERMFARSLPFVTNRIHANIFRYFNGKASFPHALSNTIERSVIEALKSNVFDKFNNVQKESKLLIQSFNKFEILLIESLERETILSPETQVSLLSEKFVLDTKVKRQAIIDRLLRRIRCFNDIILTLDFLKCMDYQRQGLVPVKGHTLRLKEVFVKNFRGEIPEVVKYVNTHLNNNSLKTLVLLFNCCSELEKSGHHQDRLDLVNSLKTLISGNFPTSWNQFILNVLNDQSLSWNEIEAIVQVVIAIRKRKNIPRNAYCEIFVREVSEEPRLTIAIRAEGTAFQYLSISWQLRESLEVLAANILKHNRFPKAFKDFYALIIRENSDPKEVFLDFLKEMEILIGAPPHLSLWIKGLQSKLGPQAIVEAEKQAVFSHLPTRSKELWSPAPVSFKANLCFKLMNEKKSSEAWELIENLLENNEEEGKSLLKEVVRFLYQQDHHFYEIFWNCSQVIYHLKKIDDLKVFTAFIEKLVVFSKSNPELLTKARQCLEARLVQTPEILSKETALIFKLLTLIYSETSPLNPHLVEALRKELPEMLKNLRNHTEPILFDLLEWCSKYPEIMRLNLTNAGSMFLAYGMKIQKGESPNESQKVLILKVISKLAQLTQNIESDRSHLFWKDLEFFYSECLQHEQYELAFAVLQSFDKASLTYQLLSYGYFDQLKSLEKTNEKYFKALFHKELPLGIKQIPKYAELSMKYLESHLEDLNLEMILKFLNFAPSGSPLFWNKVLRKMITSSETHIVIRSVHTYWNAVAWDNEFWTKHLELWAECLVLSHTIEIKIFGSSTLSFTNHIDELKSLSATSIFKQLIALYLKVLAERKSTKNNCDVAKQLRSMVNPSIDQEWVKIDTSICVLCSDLPNYDEFTYKLLFNLLPCDASKTLRKAQEIVFFKIYLRAMVNNDEFFKKLEEVRKKAKEIKDWNGFCPEIINLYSNKKEHCEIVLEQVSLLAKNINRLKEVNFEILAKLILNELTPKNAFEIPVDDIFTILYSPLCRKNDHFTECFLILIEHENIKQLSNKEYFSYIKTLPNKVIISEVVFNHAINRFSDLLRKGLISEYLDVMEFFCLSVHDILDIKKEVFYVRDLKRFFAFKVDSLDLAGEGTKFQLRFNYTLLPVLQECGNAETEPSQRRKFCDILLQMAFPTLALVPPEKFIPYLDSGLYMMKPVHGNMFKDHCLERASNLVTFTKFVEHVVFPWKVKLLEYLYYLGIQDSQRSVFTKISYTTTEKLQCIINIIKLLSKDKDEETYNYIVVLIGFTESLLKSEFEEIYHEFSKAVFTYIFSVAHLPFKTFSNVESKFQTPIEKIAFSIDIFSFPNVGDYSAKDIDYYSFMVKECFKLCKEHPNLMCNNELFLKRAFQFLNFNLPRLFHQYDSKFAELLAEWSSLFILAASKDHKNADEWIRIIFDTLFCPILAKTDAARAFRSGYFIFFLKCLISENNENCFVFASGLHLLGVLEKIYFNQEHSDRAAAVFKEKNIEFVIFDPSNP